MSEGTDTHCYWCGHHLEFHRVYSPHPCWVKHCTCNEFRSITEGEPNE